MHFAVLDRGALPLQIAAAVGTTFWILPGGVPGRPGDPGAALRGSQGAPGALFGPNKGEGDNFSTFRGGLPAPPDPPDPHPPAFPSRILGAPGNLESQGARSRGMPGARVLGPVTWARGPFARGPWALALGAQPPGTQTPSPHAPPRPHRPGATHSLTHTHTRSFGSRRKREGTRPGQVQG